MHCLVVEECTPGSTRLSSRCSDENRPFLVAGQKRLSVYSLFIDNVIR